MKSDLHKSIYGIIKLIYPRETLEEEYPIKIGNKTLFIDIYIPRLNIAIECDGIQHDQFSKFYHQDIFTFKNQQKNDKLKEEYCAEKGITIVRISHKDPLNETFIGNKIIKSLKEV